MEMKKMIRTGILVTLAALTATSCVTNRKVAYLQDMKHGTQIELENKFEAVISAYDELIVMVSSFDGELAKPFNLGNVSREASGGTSNQNIGYLVDQYGNIEMPVLGTIHAAGLTRLQLQEKVRDLLKPKNAKLVLDPKVREMILEQGSSAEFGARLYRRQVERLIEDPLSDAILAASAKENFQAVGHPTPDGKAVIFDIVPAL